MIIHEVMGIFMKSVFYLTYASRMTWRAGMNRNVFVDIYQTANHFNATQDITGFLCFGNGYFFQYLEGDETKVKALYERICKDQRHSKITLLTTGYIEKKYFSHWDMAFTNIHNANLSPKMVNLGSWMPLKWKEKEVNYLITLFRNVYHTSPHDTKIKNDDLVYHYAGLSHLFKQYYNLLVLQSILIVIAFVVWLIIKFNVN